MESLGLSVPLLFDFEFQTQKTLFFSPSAYEAPSVDDGGRQDQLVHGALSASL
jgi:hypothetical protein